MDSIIRLIPDFYWWWSGLFFLFLGWDLRQKNTWPSVMGVLLTKKKHRQKFLVGDEEDTPIPMDKEPVTLLSGKPKSTYVKTTRSVEYEYIVQKKTYTGQKVFEHVESNYLLGVLFDQEDVRLPKAGEKITVYYNPNRPGESLLTKSSLFSVYLTVSLGIACLVLGYFFQTG